MKCLKCNKEFFSNYSFQKFCDKKCSSKYHDKLRYEKRREIIKRLNLEFYHKNKKRIIPQQISYKMKKYKTDKKFHKIDNIRKNSAHAISLKDKQCEVCCSKQDLQRHHPDYSNPKIVMIVCRKCHNNIKPLKNIDLSK